MATLASLPVHHHVLCALIRRHGAIAASDLYDRYDDVAERVYREREKTPIVRRHRRTALTKLERYDLLSREGTAPHYRYRVCDASITSPIDLPALTRPQ